MLLVEVGGDVWEEKSPTPVRVYLRIACLAEDLRSSHIPKKSLMEMGRKVQNVFRVFSRSWR